MICSECGSDDVVRAGPGNAHPTGTPICRGDCHGPTTTVAAEEGDAEQTPSTPESPGLLSRLLGANQETEE